MPAVLVFSANYTFYKERAKALAMMVSGQTLAMLALGRFCHENGNRMIVANASSVGMWNLHRFKTVFLSSSTSGDEGVNIIIQIDVVYYTSTSSTTKSGHKFVSSGKP